MLLSKICLNIFISLCSSLLTALGFYKLDILIFFSLFPFLYVLSKIDNALKRFLLGYIWGIFFFFSLCYWIYHFTFLGLILLLVYLSLYPAIFAYLFKIKNKSYNIFYSAGLWVCLEFIRAYLLTGFPWGYLGYALSRRIYLIQFADITGVYGVSYLIVLSNSVILYLFLRNKLRKKIFQISVLGLFLIFTFIYGYLRFKNLKSQDLIKNIAIVQTNTEPRFKWDETYYKENLEKFRLLTSIAKYKDAKLIIYPETILPYAFNQEKELEQDVSRVIQDINLPVVLGLPFFKHGKYYNASIFMNRDATVKDIYLKMKLVPFGEYIPMKKILGFLGNLYPIGEYNRGDELKIFNYDGYKFSVLICYENIFSEIARKAVILGADFLINQSDEGWFKQSSEIYLHNQIAIFRAIENRRSIIRATNTGLSCVIDYNGKIINKLQPFTPDVLVCDLPIYKGTSFYTRFGWLFAWLILIFIVFYLIKFR